MYSPPFDIINVILDKKRHSCIIFLVHKHQNALCFYGAAGAASFLAFFGALALATLGTGAAASATGAAALGAFSFFSLGALTFFGAVAFLVTFLAVVAAAFLGAAAFLRRRRLFGGRLLHCGTCLLNGCSLLLWFCGRRTFFYFLHHLFGLCGIGTLFLGI